MTPTPLCLLICQLVWHLLCRGWMTCSYWHLLWTKGETTDLAVQFSLATLLSSGGLWVLLQASSPHLYFVLCLSLPIRREGDEWLKWCVCLVTFNSGYMIASNELYWPGCDRAKFSQRMELSQERWGASAIQCLKWLLWVTGFFCFKIFWPCCGMEMWEFILTGRPFPEPSVKSLAVMLWPSHAPWCTHRQINVTNKINHWRKVCSRTNQPTFCV